jgi:hypothetical protein
MSTLACKQEVGDRRWDRTQSAEQAQARQKRAGLYAPHAHALSALSTGMGLVAADWHLGCVSASEEHDREGRAYGNGAQLGETDQS